MCPDRQLLSVYFDGELPSPWKEKMESHIAGCLSCREHLEAYGRLSPGSFPADAAADAGAIEAARDRVWKTLEPRISPAQPAARIMTFSSGLWQRRLSIPIPAAAAIAVLFIALAVMTIIRQPNTAVRPGMVLASETDFDAAGIIPLASMEEVLQQLAGGRDNGEVLIIRLPESRNFTSYGEPAIINAADYSRINPARRRP